MVNKFVLADLHRAMQRGEKSLEISVVDLSELLASLESLEARQSNEANGKHLGFATGHKLKSMLAGSRKYITVSAYKSEVFDSEVTYLEVPR